MSPAGRKKSRAQNPQELYDEIKGINPRPIRRCFNAPNAPITPLDLLIRTKPKLKDGIAKDGTITQDLHKIASLAQAFAEQRPKSNKNCQLADFLDQEGSLSLFGISVDDMKLNPVSRFRCQPVECIRRGPSMLCCA
jgi:hypothetical protein